MDLLQYCITCWPNLLVAPGKCLKSMADEMLPAFGASAKCDICDVNNRLIIALVSETDDRIVCHQLQTSPISLKHLDP